MKTVILALSLCLATIGGAEAIEFKNCKAAFAAGYHDTKQGQPGYAPKLDRDKDGVACETDNHWVKSKPDYVQAMRRGGIIAVSEAQ